MPLAKPNPKQKSKGAPPPIHTADLNPFRSSTTSTRVSSGIGNNEGSTDTNIITTTLSHPAFSAATSGSSTPPSPPISTQTLVLTHPTVARLSSSPASSPRIVDSPAHVRRARSVRPEMDGIEIEPDTPMDRRALKDSHTTGPMQHNADLGPDFFFYSDSSDEDGDVNAEEEHESEWEDEEATREFSGFEGVGLGISGVEDEGHDTRKHEDAGYIPLEPSPTHDSGTALSNKNDNEKTKGDVDTTTTPVRKDSKKARQLSIGRAGRAKVVHNHGSNPNSGTVTPRDRESLLSSTRSNSSTNLSRSSTSESSLFPSASTTATHNPPPPITRHDHHHHHRRNTSESLHAVLRTHAMTMRALESISPSASLSLAHTHAHTHARNRSLSQPQLTHPNNATAFSFLRSPSLTSNRHITLDPIVTDPNRPPHLPAHFIKTPYPFTAKKEFPRPAGTRPRGGGGGVRGGGVREDDAAIKGKQVLGLEASEMDLQALKGKQVLGLVGGGGAGTGTGAGKMGWVSVQRSGGGGCGGHDYDGKTSGDGDSEKESIVWLTLRPGRCTLGKATATLKVEKIIVPSSLVTTVPVHSSSSPSSSSSRHHQNQHRSGAKTSKSKSKSKRVRGGGGRGGKAKSEENIDFDDKYLAECLRRAYESLAGSWFARTFSARRLVGLEVGSVGVWSGTSVSSSCGGGTAGLLATGYGGWDGRGSGGADETVFTERRLWELYRAPGKGKARYTWVHWARRVAGVNEGCGGCGCGCEGAKNMEIKENGNGDVETGLGVGVVESDDGDGDGDGEERVLGRCQGGGSGSASASENEDHHHHEKDPNTTTTFTQHQHQPHQTPHIPTTITTIQFIRTYSPTRILVALSTIVVLTIAAAMLWIFFGYSATSMGLEDGGDGRGEEGMRGERVGTGMLVGVLAFLLQAGGFGCWVWMS